MDHTSAAFFHNVGEEETWIDSLLRTDLPAILSELLPWRAAQSCLLADVGDYIVRILSILSRFATRIAHGETVRAYASSNATALADERRMQTTDYPNDKHAVLKRSADKLYSTTEECKDIWASGPDAPANSDDEIQPPNPDQVQVGRPMAYRQHPSSGPSRTSVGPSSFASTSPPRHEQASSSPECDSSTQQDDHTARAGSHVPAGESWMKRGSDRNVCPHGHSCTKGGVQPDENLTVFVHNSAFRAHLQQHEIWFKCDVPGCTNTKGFSRRDGLERHKRTIHGME